MSIFGELDREAVDDEIRGLRQRIAELEAEIRRLKQRHQDVCDAVTKHCPVEQINQIMQTALASRSKEPKGATE